MILVVYLHLAHVLSISFHSDCFEIVDVNIIHLQSAHSFREYTFYMLNDAETLADLEETGLKFIPITDYNALKEEVVIAKGKLE